MITSDPTPDTRSPVAEEPDAPDRRWETAKQYALVELAGQCLAIDIASAAQILERPPVTPVPNTPDFVLGVCNVRGDIHSIVDIRPLLGFAPIDQGAHPDPIVILLESSRFVCGATVERVRELLRISDAHIVAPTAEIPYVSGLCRRGQETVLVLDVEALLGSPEMTRFQ